MLFLKAIRQLERLVLSTNKQSSDIRSSIDLIGEADATVGDRSEKIGEPSHQQQRQQQLKEDKELNDIEDPVLRKAIKKMRRLDKVLLQKVANEQDVKRQRLMMHRQYHDELERIKHGLDRVEPKDEKENTLKFLALESPLGHWEGMLQC